jgi:hypothetical protein
MRDRFNELGGLIFFRPFEGLKCHADKTIVCREALKRHANITVVPTGLFFLPFL